MGRGMPCCLPCSCPCDMLSCHNHGAGWVMSTYLVDMGWLAAACWPLLCPLTGSSPMATPLFLQAASVSPWVQSRTHMRIIFGWARQLPACRRAQQHLLGLFLHGIPRFLASFLALPAWHYHPHLHTTTMMMMMEVDDGGACWMDGISRTAGCRSCLRQSAVAMGGGGSIIMRLAGQL